MAANHLDKVHAQPHRRSYFVLEFPVSATGLVRADEIYQRLLEARTCYS